MKEISSFKIVGEIAFSELEKKLRATTLLGQPDIRPYENARITIDRFAWDEVLSTTKFVEDGLLEVQLAIRESITPHGFDQLELEGGLILDAGEGPIGIIPPIVELFDSESMTPYVLDGAHRTYLGYTNPNRYPSFLGILVTGIRSDCPPYAFPNKWEEVKKVAKRPEDKSTWKNYRNFAERYKLYRDYSHIIKSEPRGLGGKTL